ncbi:hypothetical protein GCM10027169_00190 [Gordonia jinhuaensis]|uniref:MspA protein n=1 Tax=Gordonia jinhuaensis TaxID=1517702 RepID=A0A916WPI4_9ACTN|nr:hypothetical protein [Gordonia jinhuaensis]GGB18210.1 hypothetical protein GCM10011489_02850 [Gordonia jinhuaensis]
MKNTNTFRNRVAAAVLATGAAAAVAGGVLGTGTASAADGLSAPAPGVYRAIAGIPGIPGLPGSTLWAGQATIRDGVLTVAGHSGTLHRVPGGESTVIAGSPITVHDGIDGIDVFDVDIAGVPDAGALAR